MKNVNSVVFAMCLVLGTGSVFAQADQMGKAPMSHDKMTQSGKTGMKKNAMSHDAMKGAMPKSSMAKDAMPKNGDAMQDNMGHDMGKDSAQH